MEQRPGAGMIDRGRCNLLGVYVHAVDYETAVTRILSAAQDQRPLGVSALAVHGVMTGVMDLEHRHRLNQLELVVPDGQPIRWGLNWLHGSQLRDRVYGPQLTVEVCQAAEAKRLPIALYGGSPELLNRLQQKLRQRFPALEVAVAIPSQFRRLRAEEKQPIVDQIRASGARITLVGLGCPRQEIWAYEFNDALQMPVLAVGAAFNFLAGELKQAPRWMQNAGLEWLFRLAVEPRRLWRRYLLLNPLYLYLLTCQKLGWYSASPERAIKPLTEVLNG